MISFLTSGESHGRALSGIIEGIPAGLPLGERDINLELSRRQKGYGRSGRQKIEQDRIQILSGVRWGKTLGGPIGLLLTNKDWENWKGIMDIEPPDGEIKKLTLPRPGHADYVGWKKYGLDDVRNVIERSSARETAMRVALGAVCKKFLTATGVEIGSHVIQIGKIQCPNALKPGFVLRRINERADPSPVRCLDKKAEKQMVGLIDQAKKKGDTLGGVFEVIATGVPIGLGSYSQWNKRLTARFGEAILSIHAIKGVEVGLGFDSAEKFGSEVHDEFILKNGKIARSSNRAGGIEGGISNGEPVIIRAAMKPISSLLRPLQTVDLITMKVHQSHYERSDICAVPACSIVAEAMVALVLTNAFLEKFGGDSLDEISGRVTNWKKKI